MPCAEVTFRFLVPHSHAEHLEAMQTMMNQQKKKVSGPDLKTIGEILQESINAVDGELLTWGILVFQKINT